MANFSSKGLSIIYSNLAGTIVFTIVFLYFYLKEKLNYLKFWSIYWFFSTLSFIIFSFYSYYQIKMLIFLYILVNIFGSLFLLLGSYEFLNISFNKKWYMITIFFSFIGIIQFILNYNKLLILFAVYFTSIIYIFNSYLLYKKRNKIICKFSAFLSLSFGIFMFLSSFLYKLNWFIPLSNYFIGSIGLLFGLSLIGIYYENLQERLELQEKHYKNIFAKSPTGMLLIDKNGKILKANEAHCEFSGYKKSELEGMNIFETVVPEEHIASAKNNIKKILNGEELEYVGKSINKFGEEIYIFFKETKVKLPDGKNCVLSMQVDYTDYKKQQKKIKYISFHDELTDLYNRSYMEEEIKRLNTRRQLPISFIMIDVNGLKIINDSYGHQKGDKLLKKTAEILKSSVRKEDIVARWAGDEFVILLPNTNEDKAKIIKNRIKEKCMKTEKDEIPVSLGIGIATKEDEKENIYDVLNSADKLMYKNKLTESKSAKNKLLKNLLSTLGAKSDETEEHALRMTNLAFKLGDKVNLNDEQLNILSLLATLHDIGKVTISEEILSKKSKLTTEEWEKIKEHPKMGYRIASASEEFAPVAKYILHHHERWDGTGYPSGLKGKDIPLLSRIITIVDAYDVMTNGRPYKKAMDKEEVIKELRDCAGSQFDPELVEEFIAIINEE